MMFGLRARMCSTSIFIDWRAAGRKLVRKTSAVSASLYRSSSPSSLRMSMPMLRLPRFGCSIMKFGMPPPPPIRPEVISPRCGSPVSGCSTLMTSAPQSAKTAPAAGTNVHVATSMTRTPASTSSIGARYFRPMPGIEPTYDELLARTDGPPGSSWGVWPGREVLGCLNRITPERRRRAAGLVETGEVHALDLDPELPDPPLFGRARLQREVTWLGEVGHDEILGNYNTQASTQWDGFRHIASREHGFHGGVADEDHGVHHWANHGI